MNRIIIPAFCLLMLAACATRENSGGYTSDADFNDNVKVGQSTRDEVLQQFGSPSTQSSFGAETWYYITNRTETIAFLKPEVVDQDVTEIEFDSGGVVSEMRSYSKKDGRDIAIARRTTPTEGHTLGFFEQAVGNIGRFNQSGGPNRNSAAPGRRPSSGF